MSECPSLAIYTQGENFQDAMNMMVDAIQSLVGRTDFEIEAFSYDDENGTFGIRMDEQVFSALHEERMPLIRAERIEKW